MAGSESKARLFFKILHPAGSQSKAKLFKIFQQDLGGKGRVGLTDRKKMEGKGAAVGMRGR
jgi:hypothetical protein